MERQRRHRLARLLQYIHCYFRPELDTGAFSKSLNSASAPRRPTTVRLAGTFQACCWLKPAPIHKAIFCSAKHSSPLAIAPRAPKRHAASHGVGSRLAASMRSRASKKAALFCGLNRLVQDIAALTNHAARTLHLRSSICVAAFFARDGVNDVTANVIKVIEECHLTCNRRRHSLALPIPQELLYVAEGRSMPFVSGIRTTDTELAS